MSQCVRPADLKINYVLLAKIKRVRIADRTHGSKPDHAIFHRPILRCQKPCNWSLSSGRKKKKKISWNNPSTVSTFANALVAVQQLSYGSIKVRHSSSESIDDIGIANNIAHSANNENPGCYNFLWTWEDTKLNNNDDDDYDDEMLEESSPNMKDGQFSMLRLCCSTDSTDDSATSEI